MKKYLSLLLATAALSGCASTQAMPMGNAEVFGKVAILDTDGRDMTQLCGTTIDGDGMLRQKAAMGDVMIKQITCISGQYIYRIKPGAMTVNVPSDNKAVYFGDVAIKLHSDGTYGVENMGHNSSGLYDGDLQALNGSLQTGGGATWVKTYMGGGSF